MSLLTNLVQDARYALRVMRAQPLFTAMAVLSLALGIGANTAIFSFMDAILLRALPVHHPEQLVVLNWHSKNFPDVAHSLNGATFNDPKMGFSSRHFPFASFEALRDGSEFAFSTLFAFDAAGQINVAVHGQSQLGGGEYVSGGYFAGLGVTPAAGRLIGAADDRDGAPPTAVLSYAFAGRLFADASAAVGQAISVNDTPFTVVGVTPREFHGIDPSGPQDVYLPLHANGLAHVSTARDLADRLFTDKNFYWLEMMGRLRPGVSQQQAQTALAPLFAHYVESTKRPKDSADLPALYLEDGAGGLDILRRQYSKPLYVLIVMVALILAIACANIANLLLARASGRRREIALRLSLGAGRGRVIRQLLTESVLLASLGGILGVAFAAWGIRALTTLLSNGHDSFTLHATLDWRVLSVTLALSLATGIFFGLAPALQSARMDLNGVLRQSKSGERGFHFYSWLRISPGSVLVAGQIAVSLLLLVAAGLFIRTLGNLNSLALGFEKQGVLLFSVNAHQVGYHDENLSRFYQSLQQRLAAIPGVRSVSASDYALLSGSGNITGVKLQGAFVKGRPTSFLDVGAGFFSTMRIPILLGREISDRDMLPGRTVAVVNERFARAYFPNRNPIGEHFGLGSRGSSQEIEIVGVCANARYESLKDDIPNIAYVPYSQNLLSLGSLVFELRTTGDPASLVSAVRETLRQADARVPAFDVRTQTEQVNQSISQERTFATLCTCFGILAALIACVGLYGTMTYNVARRTNEIGIRMALGAERQRMVWMVLRDVLAMAAAGLAIGLIAAVAASRILESFLFQLRASDPIVLAGAAGILLMAALAAGYAPARRAAGVDPWTALRDE